MFNNISMGQGQEMVAINAVNKAARDGHWVVLQNIHLMQAVVGWVGVGGKVPVTVWSGWRF